MHFFLSLNCRRSSTSKLAKLENSKWLGSPTCLDYSSLFPIPALLPFVPPLVRPKLEIKDNGDCEEHINVGSVKNNHILISKSVTVVSVVNAVKTFIRAV